ncbi:PAS/PAC sensor hybrid histidine kinase [Oscillatoria nigro-viridis PCC 7112]|uniref:histidine kinase n=1 Tax=Phormidium nigroviride PCC 7112 TaxID=179408 RepID=K9VHM0_9CYAN|nr:PAS domain-containing sensor histidine kinase [Oscillatoria nigro-viridis]AFZ07019.1 PAS/PAC sensor hybrid histidine kinase [Oscillatoria nigro-viridis PCC 7112]
MKDSLTPVEKMSQEVETLHRELAEVQERLNVAEETLQAIACGEVDAVVVSTERGERVFTLQGADYVYQCLVEQMGEGAATVSSEGLILYCNKRLSEILNCPLKNLIGSQLETFIAPQYKKAFLLLLQQVQPEKSFTKEMSLIPATGNKEVPVKLSFKQLQVDEILVNSIIVTDITESKIKEAAKLSHILNSALAVIINFRLFTDGTLEIDSWAGGTQQIFGYSLEAVQADSALIIGNILPEDREKTLASFINDIQAGRSGVIEYRFLHGDRQIRWLTSNYVAEWDGEQDCWVGIEIITDITQRKETEQKIAEQAALIDITSDAIFVKDLDDRILFWNKGAERLYGWEEAEVIGQKTQTLFNKPCKLTEPIQITTEKGSWQGEIDQLTKTGKNIIVESRKTLIKNQFFHSASILVVNSDITEKKLLEKQFYHAQRLESLGTLASGIAHDLNNILTPILGASQLLPLKITNMNEPTQRLLRLLSGSAKRGAELVKQILLFSRATDGEYVILQLGYLLIETIGIIQQTFPKSITISTKIPALELWTISGDATQLHQVFMNLMINAKDAMSSGGILTVSAENRSLDEDDALLNLEAKAGCYVAVTVADTGIGIPPELLNRIFDPFFTTKEVGRGTGLGLSTVMGIVKNHGGFVKVYSELGKGTKFQVFLPAIEGEVSLTTVEEAMPRGKGELILIVDDEASIREITQTSLENYNYRTILASDGLEALDLYREHQQEISVVLMDMMMPNLDGVSAMRELQKINPGVNIIATSGLLANRKLALDANVKTFLLKPYTIAQLLQRLTEILPQDENQANRIPPVTSQESCSLPRVELSRDALAMMPPEWLQKMYDAAYYCDGDLLLQLIEQIPTSQVAIANALKDLTLSFKTDIIMELTDLYDSTASRTI